MIIPLIMSGGSGTRLWPLSRGDNPKQFHSIIDDKTMFAHTLARVSADGHSATAHGGSGAHSESQAGHGLAFGAPVVVFNARHLSLVRREMQATGITPRALIVEPFGRNTAPAIAAAIAATGTAATQDLMLMLPADHLIADVPAFHRAIATGCEAARAGALVTFGIVPNRPDTGFGYIRRGTADGSTFQVEAFVEKPDLATATQYLASGKYNWNAGIFLFRTDVMAGELKRQRAAMWSGVEASLRRSDMAADCDIVTLDPEAFAAVEGESIDYAVMENAARVNVVPVEMGWDDIGSWSQLFAATGAGGNGTVTKGDVIAIDAENSYLRSEHGLLAAVGVKDIVVVQTGDATLVAGLENVQDVKRIVDQLKARERTETEVTPRAIPVLRAARDRRGEVRSWLFDEALPFWSEAMFTPAGGITETLGLDGHTRNQEEISRLRVWARQIYVFASAKRLGWQGDADAVLDRAFSYLIRHGWRDGDGSHKDASGGWVHLAKPDGSVFDARHDTYDHAFMLLGLGHMAKVTGRRDVAEWFNRTLKVIDNSFVDQRFGGFGEGVPAGDVRRANPHMHLLEAWLANYELSGDAAYLVRAAAIVDLFHRVFFDADNWTLTEFFGHDWSQLGDARAEIVEPGHHYEWVWLLQRYAQLSGRDQSEACRRLFGFAEAFGRDHKSGRVYDRVDRKGRPIAGTARCWPQTEALKALIAMQRAGTPGLETRIDQTLSVVLDQYLRPAVPGCWMDVYDASGAPAAKDVPASTFYHLFCAFEEFLQTA